MTTPEIETLPDAAALATRVATRLLDRLGSVQAASGQPHIALSGGSTADAVHGELARLSPQSGVDWTRVVVWWGDDRFVPGDSPERNAVQARRSFLDVVGATQIHEMPSTDGTDEVAAGAAAYGSLLRSQGSGEFEIVMLGVGEDGHVASLFPGRPELDVDDRIAVAVTDSPKPPPERITLTFAALNRSRSVWFLVSGADKAAVVAAALVGDADFHDIPARGVAGGEETIWFIDTAAASKL
ncbi:MAG: 6-phosphogluconolactonase [Acidimicrobiia bacterium]|nr:6-phosphogluconolactonase [Acidimicrobiia bacterium]